jgi:hypothetical protein
MGAKAEQEEKEVRCVKSFFVETVDERIENGGQQNEYLETLDSIV